MGRVKNMHESCSPPAGFNSSSPFILLDFPLISVSCATKTNKGLGGNYGEKIINKLYVQ